MRQRGLKFRQWAERRFSAFRYSEILPGGTQLDIRIHVSEPVTLIFVGIYKSDGAMMSEDTYATLHVAHDEALRWAIVQAHWMAGA